MGYVVNIHDMCVFNKIMVDGSQSTVITHVDDIMITAKDDAMLEASINEIEKVFGEVTVHRGEVFNYLGMVFDFSKKGKVMVTMDGFMEDLFEELGDRFSGICETPAKKDLFEVGESEALEANEKYLFQSLTAKLLCLSKRVRPNILVAISFLTKRIQCPNQSDFTKLERVIKYLRGTKEMGIML